MCRSSWHSPCFLVLLRPMRTPERHWLCQCLHAVHVVVVLLHFVLPLASLFYQVHCPHTLHTCKSGDLGQNKLTGLLSFYTTQKAVSLNSPKPLNTEKLSGGRLQPYNTLEKAEGSEPS